MALVRSFKNAAPRYPERVAICMPRGTRLLAEQIAVERGVSPTDLMRGALGKALSGMVAIEPAAADQTGPENSDNGGAVTMRIADSEARYLVEKALNITICEPFAGVVIEQAGQVIGGVIFNNFTGRDVHVTWASSRPVGVNAFRQVARYVFGQLGCHRVTAITRTNNHRAVRALTRMGFLSEGVMREHFPDSDGLVFGLLRSEQKFVRL